jgi:hypothetical protein
VRAKILLFSSTAMLAVAALFFAWRERTVRSDAERDGDGHRQRQAQLAAEITLAGQQLAAAESEHGRMKAALEAARNKPANRPAAPVRTVVTTTPELATLRGAMRSNPQAQNLHLKEIRTRMEETNRPLIRELNLTEAQAAQLIEIRLKRYEQRLDVGYALEAVSPVASDNGVVARKMSEEIDDAFRVAQTTLLGEAGYAKLEYFDRTSELRRFVDEFAGRATVAGAAISGVQADALIAVMAKNSPHFQNGGAAQLANIDWSAVFAQASSELPEPQFVAFKNTVIPQWNMDRLRKLAAER